MPQRLHDVISPNSDHFQHVGQQTFMTTAHSQQWCGGHPVPRADGAETVTGSAQSGTDPGIRTFPGHEPVPRIVGVLAVLLLAGCSSQPAAAPPTERSPITEFLTIGYRNSHHHAFAGALDSRSPDATVLHPESVTFISPNVGWVLGLTLCGGSSCLRLATTADAGTSWSWVAGADLPAISPTSDWELRFANSEDGWISGSHLYSTHDGGRTWAQVALPGVGPNASVDALEFR